MPEATLEAIPERAKYTRHSLFTGKHVLFSGGGFTIKALATECSYGPANLSSHHSVPLSIVNLYGGHR